ncbi:MAG: mechanosensitive ion channel family protein [Myxococcales bacterium]|nr:mechanosensitive ion channel family protein [Myxococcales bacterium]
MDTVLFSGNTVQDMLFVAIYIAITFAAAKVVPLIFGWLAKTVTSKTKTQFDDIVLEALHKPIFWTVLIWGIDQSLRSLVLPEAVNRISRNVATVTTLMFAAWAMSNLITALRKTYLDPRVEKSENRMDDQLVPIIEKSLKVVVWVFALLIAFDNIGFDIVSLLTGLGIGGLALAMAAKDTLANVFGSVTVFADRPFQVDDVVNIKGFTGTIVELGLRTCRLKTFEGTLVTIPNSVLVGGPIENLSKREARKQVATIGLVYGTSSEALEAAIAASKAILAEHPKVRDDFAVRFNNFGGSALELQLIFWVVPPKEFLDVVNDVNLAIKRKFDAEGWEMAFPTMTIYQAKA